MRLLVTGLGRSGTKWLATYLRSCGCEAGHESALFGGQEWRGRGLYAARDMSNGRLPDWDEIKRRITAAPDDWIEVNGYLLLHAPAFVAARVPILHLIRDGRDQVRSIAARKRRAAAYLRQFRSPRGLSYLGQLAYAWNARALWLRSFRYLRFEDMLNDYDVLAATLQPYGVYPDRALWAEQRERPVNATTAHTLPAWPDWTAEQRAEFDGVATEAMRTYGYY